MEHLVHFYLEYVLSCDVRVLVDGRGPDGLWQVEVVPFGDIVVSVVRGPACRQVNVRCTGHIGKGVVRSRWLP